MAGTTLTVAQLPTDRLLHVADASNREGGFLVRVDDELEVVEGDGRLNDWRVTRAVQGSKRTEHAAGSSVIVVSAADLEHEAPAAGEPQPRAPKTIPQLPANPSPQDIADALVMLGLVVQAHA